jgi:hypothetical protein
MKGGEIERGMANFGLDGETGGKKRNSRYCLKPNSGYQHGVRFDVRVILARKDLGLAPDHEQPLEPVAA